MASACPSVAPPSRCPLGASLCARSPRMAGPLLIQWRAAIGRRRRGMARHSHHSTGPGKTRYTAAGPQGMCESRQRQHQQICTFNGYSWCLSQVQSLEVIGKISRIQNMQTAPSWILYLLGLGEDRKNIPCFIFIKYTCVENCLVLCSALFIRFC